MLRAPRVRDALARATYQGVVRYFNTLDNSVPLTMVPGQVRNVYAQGSGIGKVQLNWDPPQVDSARGDAPTGYRIYVSTDGYGFDGGTDVGLTTNHTLTGLDPDTMYYFLSLIHI